MRDAIQVVLDNASGGEVRWVDVRDQITSGQWGRLIEKEVLVDGDEGFALADRDEIEAGMEDDSGGSDVETPETTTWSKWDKLAGVATLGAFVGYAVSPVRNAIAGGIDVVLGPLLNVVPFYVVIMVIALGTGLYSTLLRAGLMDMEKMGAYQERMKDIQERRKAAEERDDDEALDEIQEEQMEAMGDQLGMFKEQFRPMVWIMLVNIPVFLWIYYMVQTGAMVSASGPVMVLPLFGEIASWSQRIGPMWAWIVWYFVCSMSFTQIVRKALNVQTTPSTS